jgi:hypothetical protein
VVQIKAALFKHRQGDALNLTAAQKAKLKTAFERLYNHFRAKGRQVSTKPKKRPEYWEKNILWAARSPRRGYERTALSENCGGRNCFLLPTEKKFPICSVCKKRSCSCKPDCGGLLSAYRRAKQMESRYPSQAPKYERLARLGYGKAVRNSCGWTERSQKRKRDEKATLKRRKSPKK